MLRLEIDVGPIPPGPHSPSPLRRAALLFVNPPYSLIDEARLFAPYLTKLLTRAGEGSHVCEWLRPPELTRLLSPLLRRELGGRVERPVYDLSDASSKGRDPSPSPSPCPLPAKRGEGIGHAFLNTH